MNAMTARLVSNSSKASCDNSHKKQSKTVALTASSPGTPRPSDGRRANKPLMEKRRRARINQSLAVLKTLILDSARLENTKHSKLEKADILELTVRHLQRQRTLSSSVLSKYRAGFQECTREVSRFLESSDLLSPTSSSSSSSPAPPPLDPGLKQRLLRHLESCVAELDLDFGLCAAAEQPESSIKAEADSEARPDSSTTNGGDENNNSNPLPTPARPESSCGKTSPLGSTVVSGSDSPEPELDTAVATTSTSSPNNPLLSVVQVIPSRLPDGQVVFLLPSHYVQLAAAAGAVWGTTTEKSKQDDEEDEDSPDQPIDFTVPRRVEDAVKDEGPVWRPW
ncbi:transcription factor HES-1 [Anabrus simplex]|uniref:transcription factor HES-1 n=1 Tax=Anabrus simplex TaxID=316456 RepID=UPI0035A2A5D5